MEQLNLGRAIDRQKAALHAFQYPQGAHERKHRPGGYKTYESYRDWLRDEFSYRCVFSLARETWPGFSFHLDHLIPQTEREDLALDYDNLLLITNQLNLIKGSKPLPDPCKHDLGRCLRVIPEGARTGEIVAEESPGEEIIDILRLDSEDATRTRKIWLEILRTAAAENEDLFRKLIGYPRELPDLNRKRVQENERPKGIDESAFARRRQGTLPDWY